jgi:hypothetical protein
MGLSWWQRLTFNRCRISQRHQPWNLSGSARSTTQGHELCCTVRMNSAMASLSIRLGGPTSVTCWLRVNSRLKYRSIYGKPKQVLVSMLTLERCVRMRLWRSALITSTANSVISDTQTSPTQTQTRITIDTIQLPICTKNTNRQQSTKQLSVSNFTKNRHFWKNLNLSQTSALSTSSAKICTNTASQWLIAY